MKHLVLLLSFFIPVLLLAQSTTEKAENFISNYQFEQALKVLQENYDTLNTTLQRQAGYCYSRLGNYKKAIACYEGALKADSSDRTSLNQLGQLYSRNDDYEKAIACYDRLISLDSLNSFYYKQYAMLSAESNNVINAVLGFYKVLELNPSDMEAYGGLGNILLEMEDFATLDTIIESGLSQDLDNQQLILLKARSHYGQKQYKDVIRTINELLTISDTLVIHARLLGISYFQLDQYVNVLPCMKFIIDSGQESEWAYYYMGMSYRNLGDIPASIEYLDKAVQESISDNISIYYTQLGRSYEDNKQFKSAIRCYKAAYESSKSGILLYHLARNYDTVYKDKSQATTYYKRYLNSDDTIKVAREYSRKRLDTLADYK